ncbi:MAG: hypothetical protein HKM06_07510 [Spirochaetales bacterium]|nr:hypothetical protein [Spirochaetales bacterium]
MAIVGFERVSGSGRPEGSIQDEFQFVVYKHGDYGKKHVYFHPVGQPVPTISKERLLCGVQVQPWYQMTSIQKCRDIPPRVLYGFLSRILADKPLARLMRKHLIAQPFEKDYIVTMRQNLCGELKVFDVRIVPESEDYTSLLHFH